MTTLFKTTNTTFDFTYNGKTEVTTSAKTGEVINTSPYVLKQFSPANVKVLGYPFGLSGWGETILDKSATKTSGKRVRVRFTLKEDVIVDKDFRQPVVIKAGKYDYFLPIPKQQDWSGWFKD